jgi:hypothetical protein
MSMDLPKKPEDLKLVRKPNFTQIQSLGLKLVYKVKLILKISHLRNKLSSSEALNSRQMISRFSPRNVQARFMFRIDKKVPLLNLECLIRNQSKKYRLPWAQRSQKGSKTSEKTSQ